MEFNRDLLGEDEDEDVVVVELLPFKMMDSSDEQDEIELNDDFLEKAFESVSNLLSLMLLIFVAEESTFLSDSTFSWF